MMKEPLSHRTTSTDSPLGAGGGLSQGQAMPQAESGCILGVILNPGLKAGATLR
jgi:hypothetical protein